MIRSWWATRFEPTSNLLRTSFEPASVMEFGFSLHSTLVGPSGRQPNFVAFSRGRHLYSAGRPSRWALAHILFFFWRGTAVSPDASHGELHASPWTETPGSASVSAPRIPDIRFTQTLSLYDAAATRGVSRGYKRICNFSLHYTSKGHFSYWYHCIFLFFFYLNGEIKMYIGNDRLK